MPAGTYVRLTGKHCENHPSGTLIPCKTDLRPAGMAVIGRLLPACPVSNHSRAAVFVFDSDSGSTSRWLTASKASSRRFDTPTLLKTFVR
jgi:hypothetical protein